MDFNGGLHVESGLSTQQDPIGIAGGLNLYEYANGDPINFSDPFGLCTQEKWWTCKILSFTGGVRFGLGVEGNVLGAKVKLNSANAGASGTMSMGTDGLSGTADAKVSLGGVDINLGPVLKFNRDFGTCSASPGCEESVSASAGVGGASVNDHGDVSAGATLGVVKVGVKLHAANLVTATVGLAKWLFGVASDQVHVGKEPEE